MFKNKKIVLFLLVLPLVAVLVAPKVALADDDSDWVKNIPIIGGVVDFASDPGGWITDRFAEGAEFFFNDGLQNIKTTSTKSILGKSFNNLLGKKTGTFYSTVSFVNKSVVMPTAASISSRVMSAIMPYHSATYTTWIPQATFQKNVGAIPFLLTGNARPSWPCRTVCRPRRSLNIRMSSAGSTAWRCRLSPMITPSAT